MSQVTKLWYPSTSNHDVITATCHPLLDFWDPENAKSACHLSIVRPCHGVVNHHVGSIRTNCYLPHIPLGGERKGLIWPGFVSNSFVNMFLCFPMVEHFIATFISHFSSICQFSLFAIRRSLNRWHTMSHVSSIRFTNPPILMVL